MNLDESRWPDAEHCWLLQAMLVFLLASSRIPPNFLCAQKIPCFTQWWNIYIYAAWNSVLSLQHTATRALESKLLETKEILGICFPEILRRKQEIWDLGTGAISTRKVHWRVLGGNWWTIHTFLTLGCHGREDQGRSSRFIFVIWRYLGILGFAAVSTRIHNHHTRRLAHQWAFWASGQPRVKKTPQYHPEFVDVSPLFVVRKPSYA